MPIAKGDLAIIAAAGDAGGAALLLAAIDPIRKTVVGDHVVELRRGLVVPGTPSLAAVHADGCALVAGQQNDLRIFGIDPNGVIVVAAGRTFDGGKVAAAVG